MAYRRGNCKSNPLTSAISCGILKNTESYTRGTFSVSEGGSVISCMIIIWARTGFDGDFEVREAIRGSRDHVKT